MAGRRAPRRQERTAIPRNTDVSRQQTASRKQVRRRKLRSGFRKINVPLGHQADGTEARPGHGFLMEKMMQRVVRGQQANDAQQCCQQAGHRCPARAAKPLPFPLHVLQISQIHANGKAYSKAACPRRAPPNRSNRPFGGSDVFGCRGTWRVASR